MDSTFLRSKSRGEIGDSAVRYEDADISSVDYEPSEPFKGLFCTAAGDVVITGVDGVNSSALPLTVGVWPLAGIKVVKTGTTATLVALF